MQPAWRNDILACYPALLARLQSIPQVKKVLEIHDIEEVQNGTKAPLDGVVYVAFDGLTVAETADYQQAQKIQLGFSVILASRSLLAKPNTDSVGCTLTAIAKALQGFIPRDEQGNELTLSPFSQKNPLPVMYLKGFGYFPLRFSTDVALIAQGKE